MTFEVLWFRYMGSNPSISYPSQLCSHVANTSGSHKVEAQSLTERWTVWTQVEEYLDPGYFLYLKFQCSIKNVCTQFI